MKKVSEIGEKRIIQEIITPLLGKEIGDDCAIIDLGRQYFVVTTDRMLEKPIGLRLGLMDYYDVGHYLAVLNLSDIASMGAKPQGLMAAVGLTKDFLAKDLRALIKGIRDACKDNKTKYIGGDIKETSVFSLVGSAFGIVDKDKILKRDKARIGDVIFTTGYIGLFATALYYYSKAKPRGMVLTIKEENLLKNQLIHPKVKFEEAYLLRDSELCTSCIDTSDGFAMSIYELINSNKKGFFISEEKLPIHKISYKVAEYLKANILEMLFSIGGDYELLGSIKSKNHIKLSNSFSKDNKKLFILGEVIKEKDFLLARKNGKAEKIEAQGWNHFISDAYTLLRK